MRRVRPICVGWLVCALAPAAAIALDGCQSQRPVANVQAAEAGPMPAPSETRPKDFPGLHNVVAYTNTLVSGSLPEGDAAFATLQAWGVRTIISVDGAQPDAETAAKYGIRYVHLPIGYNGFDDTRRLELARAARDLPGPIYVHCHHGKHRSAGAAGAMAVALGVITADAAVERMAVSGTAPEYRGLYTCVAETRPATPQQLDAASAEFPPHSRTDDLVKAMVQIDEAVEGLKAVEAAGWVTPANHPDLVPAAIAGMLADHMRIAGETPQVADESAAFRALLARSAAAAQRVEDLIIDSRASNQERSAAFMALSASCKECHTRYRD